MRFMTPNGFAAAAWFIGLPAIATPVHLFEEGRWQANPAPVDLQIPAGSNIGRHIERFDRDQARLA